MYRSLSRFTNGLFYLFLSTSIEHLRCCLFILLLILCQVHCKSLTTLNVSNNSLQSLGDIWKLRKLSIINAGHNEIASTIFLDKLKSKATTFKSISHLLLSLLLKFLLVLIFNAALVVIQYKNNTHFNLLINL